MTAGERNRKALLYAGGALIGGGLAMGLLVFATRASSGTPSVIPVRLIHSIDPQVAAMASARLRRVAEQGISSRMSGRAV